MIDISSITSAPSVIPTTSRLMARDHWDHFLARVGVKRGDHRVQPGLYALGNPTADSPVFVTANYTLSFDALRASLAGIDGYILVLDTHGINVWCAAGKGTFGTDEIVRRVMITRLGEVVKGRKLILPQLGAPGVAAHEVKKRSGFWVEYGPVRAADLPEYLKTHSATPFMRKVDFPLRNRLLLVPVDIVQTFLPMLAAAGIMYLLGGLMFALSAVAAVLAGVVLFPALLPWLPTRNFSSKGYLLGLLVALPFGVSALLQPAGETMWRYLAQALALLLMMPATTAFISLNFTGSSTFTSRTGVRREMYAFIPAMAWTFGTGSLLAVVQRFIH